MECTYHGHMVSGKKQDDNSSEEIHDTDYGTILTIEGCRYAENMLTGFRKAYVVNENASVVGFEPWLDACRAAEFRKKMCIRDRVIWLPYQSSQTDDSMCT